MTLLVLVALSVQLAIGAQAALASGPERVTLRRLPTEVVRVIRDLVERRETEPDAARAMARAWAGPAPTVATPGAVATRVGPLAAWLLDLPPPSAGVVC